MELPQTCQFREEGRRKPTQHDFLSLCSHSTTSHQDPRPPNSQSGSIKTLDLLHVGKEEEYNMETYSQSPPAPPPPVAAAVGEEHVLPGGFGTYSISHISSYINNSNNNVINNQRLAPIIKPEGSLIFSSTHHHQASSITDPRNDENSNCSSYTAGNGFALWDESVANNKGMTGKENFGERANINNIREAGGGSARQWRSSSERPMQSSAADYHRSSFGSHSLASALKSRSFMEMFKSAKSSSQEEELDDNEESVFKKENSAPLKGDLRVKVDEKNIDQKANTPRSKHSATEQRRRSKINDRFQMLRELIPCNDQKRDKASFLLEVIEYVQFLQEKVHKYEGSHQGWINEPAKLMPWKNNHGPVENLVDHSCPRNGTGFGREIMFPTKFDEKIFTSSLGNAQNKTEPDTSSVSPFKAVNQEMPMSSLQPKFFNSIRTSGVVAQQHSPLLQSDATASQPQTQPLHSLRQCAGDGAVTSDKVKEQGLTVEGGSINISSIYSQGLFNTLTQALQTSGVDLSRASVSVQIELGKQGIAKSTALDSNFRDKPAPQNDRGIIRSRATEEDSDQVLKKLKMDKR